MKKILLFVALSSNMLLPFIRYDKSNDIYYPSNAINGTNLREYNDLVKRLAPWIIMDYDDILDHLLRDIKTPAAQTLFVDIVEHMLLLERKFREFDECAEQDEKEE